LNQCIHPAERDSIQ